MNLKAYIRGIGAGMIVSALFIGVGHATAPKPSEPIDKSTLISSVSSDTSPSVKEEEKTKSSAGTESSVSKETESSASVEKQESETSVSSSETSSENNESENVENTTSASTSDDKTEENSETSTPEQGEENKQTDTETSSKTEEDESAEYVTIEIVKGDSSVRAARKLFEAGLVESAVEFDKYLCENGYDKSISVGTYKIKLGSDFEDMAKIITRRKKSDQ